MWWQHSRSAGVSVAPGSTHAIAGLATHMSTMLSNKAARNRVTAIIIASYHAIFETITQIKFSRSAGLTAIPCFCNHQNMPSKKVEEQVAKFADMFSAMGTEARLRIMQLLLSAHPDGLVVSEIQEELDIPNSTLSHHLDKLRNEGLVQVRRESTFLRYTADTDALQQLLQFLYAECCTRNKALKPEQITQCCR
jgi:ArsR family transcriptional regulator